jgi:hypothetical protein
MLPCRGLLIGSAIALTIACLPGMGTSQTQAFSPFATTEVRLPQNCDWVSDPGEAQSMPTEVVDPNPRSVRLKFSEPPLSYGTETLDGREYATVRLTGEGSIAIPGDPELPKVSRLVMIANRGNVKLSVVNSSYHVQYLKGDIFPTQEMVEGGSEPLKGTTAPNFAVHKANRWYPSETARISEPATLRDVRFVGLTVYPVQVNPVTREIRVYDEIEVEVQDVGGAGSNEIPFTPESIDPGFKKLYGAFENFRGSTLDELPVMPGEYVVFCRNYPGVIAQAQRLVDWHKRKGLNASLVRLSTASYDSVKIILGQRYYASNGKLAYACVIGDPQLGTPDSLYIATHSTQYDNYFGTGLVNPNGPDNPDPVPEVAVGRISATNMFALQSVVDKTIFYETSPYTATPEWFTRTWCAPHNYSGASVYSLPSFKHYTEQIMLQHGITQVLWNVFNGSVIADTIEAKVGLGISVFNHRMAWINEMYTSDLDGLPDSWMWPFVMSITCNTGSFNSGTSVSEAWLMPTGQVPEHYRGAIGCVGLATSGTHTRLNNSLDAGAMYGLYARGIDEQGTALIAGKLQMWLNYWDDNPTGVQNFCYWSNLMGDPAVPIWKKRPRPALVTEPGTVNVGTNHVRLTVRNSYTTNFVPDALVCLWKSGQSYSRGFTDVNGQIDLPCTTSTAGNLLLTVTHSSLLADLDTILVVSSNAWLALDSILVDDDNLDSSTGDGNHIISPGEIANLTLRLRNVGTSQTVTGISSTLFGSAPGITILSATSAYPNIGVGSWGANTSRFRIGVSSVFNGEPAVLYLRVTSSAGVDTLRVSLTPHAPDVGYRRSTFFGGALNSGADGDFMVTFKNTGSFALESAHGVLRSLDPLVLVSDSLGEYGDVAAGALDSNTVNRYHISVSNGAYPGHRAVMQLVITDGNGFRDSTEFDSTNFFTTEPALMNRDSDNFVVTIGNRDSTSPTGPDAYGYYAYDNDESYPPGSGSEYQWVEISPRLGGLGTSMNFNDNAEDKDSSRSIALPFPFTFYGQSFGWVTICSNGWLALGITTINDYHNYRMGTPPGPPNQVAAYWDDLRCSGLDSNCYYYYDSVNHRFIVEWRAWLAWQSPRTMEKFEIILYDPAAYPSVTGDGKIKVQYDSVAVLINYASDQNDWCSMGIQNSDHSTGLDYYYWNTYAPGSDYIRNGRAIMYTTDATGKLVPAIHVVQPNIASNWYVGELCNVIWQSTAVQGNVNIQIKRNYPSGAWSPLFTGTPNDGIQAWTVNTPTAAGTARIRIFSVADSTICDTSDTSFSITMPTLEVVSPNGGEVLITGSPCWMSWDAVGMPSVRVELNRSFPSASWEVIRESAYQAFEWAVSGTPTMTARLRVTGISVPTVADTSDGDFTIGSPPTLTHEPHADQAPGPALFVAKVVDDVPGFVTKVYYRLTGVGNFDSTAFATTGNPDEYSATTPALGAGRYEYYVYTRDAQAFDDRVPGSGSYYFDVGTMAGAWINYDDSTAENYNWVDGTDFQWAVRFEPSSYPYVLYGARFAICPTRPSSIHQPIEVRVYRSDGTDGMPGTLLFDDTTACAGNVIGGLPAGAAWADVIVRSGGQPLQFTEPFYVSVQNPEVRVHPVAFAHDTLGTRSHRSYFYDACETQWFSEDDTVDNARPGNRMIRANGFSLAPLQVVVYRTDSAGVISAMLKWTSNGAPYYHIYSAAVAGGPYSTLEGSVVGPAAGQSVFFQDLNAIGEAVRRFYVVTGADQP